MATEAWLGEVSAAGCRSSEVTVSLPAAVDVLPPAPDGAPAAPGGKAAASADFNRAMALLSAADGGDGATPAKDEGAPISPPSSPKAKPSGGFFGGLFGSKQPQAAAAGRAAARAGEHLQGEGALGGNAAFYGFRGRASGQRSGTGTGHAQPARPIGRAARQDQQLHGQGASGGAENLLRICDVLAQAKPGRQAQAD